jgi:hypothetical protein
MSGGGSPMPDRYDFTDFIPPIGPLRVEMDCPARPRGVTLVPEGLPLEWTWANGRMRVAVPRFEIHGVVVVD